MALASCLGLIASAWRRSEEGNESFVRDIPRPRPFLARLSGGFRYAPCQTRPNAAPRNGFEGLVCDWPLSESERAAFTELERRQARRSGASATHRGYGETLWRLTTAPHVGRLGDAVERLESLTTQAPDNSTAFSDLAAALLARAARNRDPRDLLRALDSAEHAIRIEPGRPEALWNRAVTLDALDRRAGAAAWRLAAAASEAGWRDEALAAVGRSSKPGFDVLWREESTRLVEAAIRGDRLTSRSIVRAHSTEITPWLVDRLLLDWLPATRQRTGADPDRLLGELIAVAEIYTSVNGDPLMLSGLRALSDLATERDSTKFPIALRGLGRWDEARRAFAGADYALAHALFRSARQDLELIGCPLTAWLEYWEIRCAYRAGSYLGAARRAKAALETSRARESHSLRGRLSWVYGSAQVVLGFDSEALAAFRSASAALEAAGDLAGTASLSVRLASAEADAGRIDVAWQHRYRALRLSRGRESPDYLVALAELVHGARELGAPLAALTLQNEEDRAARESGDAHAMALAFRHQADLFGSLDPQAASLQISRAREEASLLPDAGARKLALVQIDLVDARSNLRRDSPRAWRLASQTVEHFRHQVPSLLPQALLVRAQARRAEGDLDGAESDLAEAMESIETLRRRRFDPSERAALVAGSAEIYSEAVSLALDRGRARAALDVAERARSRALLDWLGAEGASGHGSFRPRNLPSLLTRLPTGRAYIEYFVAPREVVVWLVRGRSIRWFRHPIEREDLRQLVAGVVRSGSGTPASGEERMGRLYDLLIRPLRPYLPEEEPLQIVASDLLLPVPFAALLDRGTGRFLIEDHPLAFAPSLQSLLLARRDRVGVDRDSISALLVVDPAFDAEAFPRLERLPAARREARVLRKLWPSTLLTDRAATSAAVLAALPGHEIVHFGAHSEVASDQPLLTRLILAPSSVPGDLGVLTANRLLGADLASVELAVFAACRSAGKPSEEGVAGLAWPLLARGVPEVLATVRDIPDDESALLIADFYRALFRGLSATRALRHAQVCRLTAGRATRRALDWGSFQLFTAVESFGPQTGGETCSR